jgi:hypothetical protein
MTGEQATSGDEATRSLADGLHSVASAVESLAQKQGDEQASKRARRAMREARKHRPKRQA